MPPSLPFEEQTNVMDYANTENWYVFGRTNNLESFVPRKFHHLIEHPKKAAVFYVHPATYWGAKWTVDEKTISQDVVKKLLLINQASAFAACCDIFAPKYRQAHIYSFFDPSRNESFKSMQIAYSDVVSAFTVFLSNIGERPFYLVGHSAGSEYLRRLIKEKEKEKNFQNNLIAAYLVGFNINTNEFEYIPVCKTFEDVNCYLGWNSTMENTNPMFSGKSLACTNPLSWESDEKTVALTNSKGAMPFTSWVYSNLTAEKDRKILTLEGFVKCHNNNLFILGNKLKDFPQRTMNLHSYDYGLFYGDILVNSLERLNNFVNK